MFIVFPAVSFLKSYPPDFILHSTFFLWPNHIVLIFQDTKYLLIHSHIDERTIPGNSLFSHVSVILLYKKERAALWTLI